MEGCDLDASIKHHESYDTAETTIAADESFFHDAEAEDEHNRECPICMDSFTVGDVASWSSYENCSHVYHHQCIKEWLLRHNNCPFCREIFLPVDRAQTKITMKVFKQLSDLRSRRAEKTFYCVQDGLVTIQSIQSSSSSRPSSSATEKVIPYTTETASTPSILRKCGHIKGESAQLKEKLKSGVTKADLRKLRGDRCDKVSNVDAEPLAIIEEPNFDAEASEAASHIPEDGTPFIRSSSGESASNAPTEDPEDYVGIETSLSAIDSQDHSDSQDGIFVGHSKVSEHSTALAAADFTLFSACCPPADTHEPTVQKIEKRSESFSPEVDGVEVDIESQVCPASSELQPVQRDSPCEETDRVAMEAAEKEEGDLEEQTASKKCSTQCEESSLTSSTSSIDSASGEDDSRKTPLSRRRAPSRLASF